MMCCTSYCLYYDTLMDPWCVCVCVCTQQHNTITYQYSTLPASYKITIHWYCIQTHTLGNSNVHVQHLAHK